MTEEEVINAIKDKSIIVYTPKGTLYKVIGLGKSKLEDGNWKEGLSYMGEDSVIYTRSFDMFKDFKIVE